ncbi:MAG: tetratricopeptide repeat protein [Candidatus Eisenbacteria bacterium]|nr:tetratricopeptide repeat protein [Candidatus Eisenbacteria bacterium]
MAGIRGAERPLARGKFVTRAIVLVGALVLASLLGACERTAERGATHRALRSSTDSLVSAGQYALARSALLSVAEGHSVPGAERWEREWARDRAVSLAPLLALDSGARGTDGDRLAASGVPCATTTCRTGRGSRTPALALLERSKGDGAHALAHNRDALRIRTAALGADSPEAAESHLRIGKDLRLSGAPQAEVLAEVERAMQIRKRCFGDRSREYAEVLSDLANFERWRKHTPAALRAFDRLLALRRSLDGPHSLPVADVLTDMAVTHLRDDDYRAIEKLSGEAVAIYDRHGSVPDDNYALSLNMHGLGLRYVGRLAEAERELQRTIVVQELRRRASPDLDVVRSRFYRLGAYGDLATVQLLKGDSLAAWNTQERGLSRRWLERAFARGELDTAGAWDHLLARVQAKLTDSSAVIGWLDPVYQSGRHGSPCWGYVIRRTGGVHWVRIELAADDLDISVQEVCLKLRRQLGFAADWPSRIERWTISTEPATTAGKSASQRSSHCSWGCAIS